MFKLFDCLYFGGRREREKGYRMMEVGSESDLINVMIKYEDFWKQR